MVFLLMCLMASLLVAFDGRSRRDGIVIVHVARLPRVVGTLLVTAAVVLSAGHDRLWAGADDALDGVTSDDLAAFIGLGGLFMAAGVFVEGGAIIQRQLFIMDPLRGSSLPAFRAVDRDSRVARMHHVLSLLSWSVLAASFIMTAVGHWRFYADADIKHSGWMAAGAGDALMDEPLCSGAMLVKNYHEAAAAFRCVSSIGWVMAEWTDRPLVPWPGYTDGRSRELSSSIWRIIQTA